MKGRPLSSAEKALIEREFIYRQTQLAAKRRTATRIFIVGIAFAFLSAVCSYIKGWVWLSLVARLFWLVGLVAFVIYAGASDRYSRAGGAESVTNPWRAWLSEIRDPAQVFQAAILLGSFTFLRLLLGMIFAFLK